MIPRFFIHHFTSIDSTNDYLKRLIEAPEFTCIIADKQTSGRGRHARVWYSAPGDGLYLSVLLCPKSPPSKIPLISLMAGIAVAEVLIQRGVNGVDIKWPNDILVNERKVCGILVEVTSTGPDTHRIILGIGVNLNHRSFPPELRVTATSLRLETGEPVAIDEFRDQLLELIAYWYEQWLKNEGEVIINRWQVLSSYTYGRNVVVALDGAEITGETAGLTETGALRIVTAGGVVKNILAGEVMTLRGSAEC
jgi:BirA family biotin operon repressor/biotin-[acetyl-CoA-carboxylase] ligase